MSPKTHLMLASSFGELEKPHKVYPHLPGYLRLFCLTMMKISCPTPILGTPTLLFEGHLHLLPFYTAD